MNIVQISVRSGGGHVYKQSKAIAYYLEGICNSFALLVCISDYLIGENLNILLLVLYDDYGGGWQGSRRIGGVEEEDI